MPKALLKYQQKLRVAAVGCVLLVLILFVWMRSWEVLFFLAVAIFLFIKALMTERNWNRGLIVKVYGKCEKVTNSLIRSRTVVSFVGMEENSSVVEHYQFVLPKRRKIYGNIIIEGSTYYLYFNKEVPGELLAYESAPEMQNVS